MFACSCLARSRRLTIAIANNSMQLPLENTFDRNANERAILAGCFGNIRISTFPTTDVQVLSAPAFASSWFLPLS